MKCNTQGQRYSGWGSWRTVTRRAALAVTILSSAVGSYVLVLAPTTSAVSNPSGAAVAARSVLAANTVSHHARVVTSRPQTRVTHSAVHANLAAMNEHPATPANRPTTSTTTAPTTSTTTAPTTSTTTAVRRSATAKPADRAVTARVTPKTVTTPTKTPPAKVAPTPAAVARTAITVAVAKLTAHLNPAANIVPSPDFLQSGSCTQNGSAWTCANPCLTPSMTWPTVNSGVACTNYVLQAIDNARATEGYGPMTLPSNWYGLSIAQQLFVVADLERTARGLPPYLGINAALSAAAQRAAATNQDPNLAAGFAVGNDPQGYPAMGGAWSGGYSVLAADYIWMYADGWGGSVATTSNVACTSAHAAGCWAHRDELLGYDPGFNPGVGLGTTNCEMGVGFAVVGNSGSFVDLIEMPASTPPAMNFTWAKNVAPYL